MVGGGRAITLSESLFRADDDADAPSTFEEERPSKGMQALLDKDAAKQARRKAKPKTIAASQFDRARHELDTMIETGDWSSARAGHLVALYDKMHLKCYGVPCSELGPAERFNAAMMAANLVKREFNGDFKKAVIFMQWVWTREISNEKWRRENGRTDARRIGARLMFTGSLLTDHRVALARTRAQT
jgi:hypothetical protein